MIWRPHIQWMSVYSWRGIAPPLVLAAIRRKFRSNSKRRNQYGEWSSKIAVWPRKAGDSVGCWSNDCRIRWCSRNTSNIRRRNGTDKCWYCRQFQHILRSRRHLRLRDERCRTTGDHSMSNDIIATVPNFTLIQAGPSTEGSRERI